MKKVLFFLAAIISSVFIACENQDSGRTTVLLGFKATGNVSENEKALRSSNGEGIFIDTAVIILEKINLTRQGSRDTIYNPMKFLLRGPYEVDLISKISKPEILPVEISPGVYTLLQGMLFRNAGYSYTLYITGTYTKDTMWWRFAYRYDKSNVFRAESVSGVEIVENQSNNVWVMIDVVALFDGVDFTHTTTESGKLIKIDSVSNTRLGDIIQANFAAATVINNVPSQNDQSNGNSQNNEKVNGNSMPDKASGDKNKNKDKDTNKDKNKDKNKNKKENKVTNKDKKKDKDNKEKNKD